MHSVTSPVRPAPQILASRFVADERGVTLIELLIVMIIIGLLSTTITMNVGAVVSDSQAEADRLKSWSVTISYDKTVVNIEGADPGDAPFDGNPIIDANNSTGVATISGTASGTGAGNGSYVLARLKVKSVGQDGQSTPLTMSNVEVRDASGAVITGVSLTNGLVTLDYTPTPVPGLTVLGAGVLGLILAALILTETRRRRSGVASGSRAR